MSTAEQREMELKDKNLHLKRDAEGVKPKMTKAEKKDHVQKKLEYHESKAEYYRQEMRKLIQT